MPGRDINPSPFVLPEKPALEDLMRILARTVRLSIRTHVPGKVLAYNPAQNKATVEVQTLQVVRVTDATRIPSTALAVEGAPPNATATLAPIILTNIPVALPVGALGGVTWPVNAGDFGMLHVSDRSLSAWLLAGAPTDPVLATTHALADSVFYPGVSPDTSPVGVDPAATVVRAGTTLKLGSNAAAQSAAIAEQLVATVDTALAAAISAAAAITPPAGDGGSAALAAFQTAWNTAKANIASTKVKVDP